MTTWPSINAGNKKKRIRKKSTEYDKEGKKYSEG